MRGIKIPQQDLALKMPGGLMHEGGGVFAGHYGIILGVHMCKVHMCRVSLVHGRCIYI